MLKDFKIKRAITFYEKYGDKYLGDRTLLEEEFSLAELKSIFGYSKKDPLLYEQYEIDEEKSKLINRKIDFDFNFKEYDYFFETFSVPVDLQVGNGIRLKDK